MTLDVSTMMYMTALVGVLIGGGMFAFASSFSTRLRPAMMTWAMALVAIALSLLCFTQRNHWPFFAAVVTGNLFASIGLALKLDTVRQLAFNERRRWGDYLVVPLAVGTAVLLGYAVDAPHLRTATMLSIYAGQLLLCVFVMRAGPSRQSVRVGRARRLIQALFAINAGVYLLRAIAVATDPASDATLLSHEITNQILFADEAVMLMVQTIAIAVMGAAVELRHRDWANQRLAVAFEAAGLSAWRIGRDPDAGRGSDLELVAGVPLRPFGRFLSTIPIGDRADVARMDALVVGQWHGTVRADVLSASADGQMRWQSLYARPVGGDGGTLPEVIVVSRDIDEERRAQIAARESAERLEMMLDAVSMVGWEVDLDSGAMTIRGNATRLLRSIPVNWSEFRALVHPEDLERFDRERDRVRETHDVARYEVRMLQANGAPRLAMVHTAMVGGDSVDGEPTLRLAGFLQDITELRHTEAALQATQDYLRRALDASGMVVWEWSADGSRRSFGDDFAIFGTSPRTVEESRQTIHRDDLARVDALRAQAIAQGVEYADEFRIVRPDGDVRWVLLRGRPELEPSGALLRLTGVVLDITSRKTAELALEAARERLQFVLQSASMWTWEIDLVSGRRSTFGDDAAVLGFSPRTLDEFVACVHPLDLDGFTQYMQSAVRERQTFKYDYRVVRRDGSIAWLQTVGRPIIGDAGDVVGLAGVVMDVSTRKEAELALVDSERLLRLSGSAARLNFWSMDLAHGDRQGGDLDFEFYGRRVRNVSTLLALLPPSDAAAVTSALDAAREGSETVSAEYRIVQTDGSVRWFAMLGHALRAQAGATPRLAGVTREITEERERSERLLAAIGRARASSEAKSEFLASMSHELRTPLNGVIGCAELLADEPLIPRHRRLVETMSESARHLLAVINDILDYSKIEAGQVEVEAIPMLLRECVESAVTLVAPQANARGLDLGLVVVGHDDREMLGDPMKIQQVIVNLLSNAVKFTEVGSVEVELDVRARLRDECSDVCITVRDTGVGVDATKRAAIFEPFRQGDASTTRRHGGTGLGLAICERLASAMKGRLEVTSVPGRGSAFALRLMLRWSDETWYVPTPTPWASRVVWVACASAFTRRAIARQLAAWGAHVETEIPLAIDPSTIVIGDAAGWTDAVLARLARPDARQLPLIETVAWSESTRTDAIAGRLPIPLFLPLRPSSLLSAIAQIGITPPSVETGDSTASSRAAPVRILVAEDNAVNATVLELMLESLGYVADFVDSGTEAVRRCADEAYDIVLMDLEMPVLDGLDAARAIRLSSRARPGPWIVAVTAHVLADSRDRILAAGMNDFVAKPIQVATLRDALRRAIQARGVDDDGRPGGNALTPDAGSDHVTRH